MRLSFGCWGCERQRKRRQMKQKAGRAVCHTAPWNDKLQPGLNGYCANCRLRTGLLVLVVFSIGMVPGLRSQEARITSFNAQGILAWSNAAPMRYCTLEVWDMAHPGWRTAPFHQYQNILAPGNTGSLDLPLWHEFAGGNPPAEAVSSEAALFRMMVSLQEYNPRSAPTTNEVLIVNRCSTSISNIILGMVGSADQASVAQIPANACSAPLLFRLPARPDVFPISWSDYSGSYTRGGQMGSIFVVLPPVKLCIYITEHGYFLW